MKLRSTQFPLHVRYADGRIKALSGQQGSFARVGPASAIDAYGRTYSVADNVPRFEGVDWVTGSSYLRASGEEGESLVYDLQLLPQAMTALVHFVDIGDSSMILRIGGETGARATISREDGAYIARLYGTTDVETSPLEPPYVTPVDLVLAIDEDGRIKLSLTPLDNEAGDFGSFEAETDWTDPAGLPSAWSDQSVTIAGDGTQGDVLMGTAVIAQGVFTPDAIRSAAGLADAVIDVSSVRVVRIDNVIYYSDDLTLPADGRLVSIGGVLFLDMF